MLTILELLAREGGDLRSEDIGQRLEIEKGTVRRLLESMISAGFVRAGQREGTYRASARLCELGSLVLDHIEIRQHASPYLTHLARVTDAVVRLVMLDDCYGLCVDEVEGQQALRVHARIGHRLPLYCTAAGKALLAGVRESERETTLRRALAAYDSRRFTANTVLALPALCHEIETIGAQGYALDREEHQPGIVGVGAPIQDRTGRVVAACSVSTSTLATATSELKALISTVVSTATDISNGLA